MLFNYTELNENILFFVENLNYHEKKLKLKQQSLSDPNQSISSLKSTLNGVNRSIEICLNSRDSNLLKISKIKKNLFIYMLKRYVGERLIVPAPKLSIRFIIYLAIHNQLDNINEVNTSKYISMANFYINFQDFLRFLNPSKVQLN